MSVPFPCEKCGSTEFTKTQTRRVARRWKMHEDFGKPVWDEAWIDPGYTRYGSCCLKAPYRGGVDETVQRHWPNYVKDDIGWVREPLRNLYRLVAYASDGSVVLYPDTGEPMGWTWKRGYLPSMFMPKVARRAWVQFETPIAQRLQEISNGDCYAEGYRENPDDLLPQLPGPRYWFLSRWNGIHGDDAWARNDWVWRYEFRRIAPPAEEKP
jgi:hypothetical protein